jgi:hypothetical protein
MSDLDKAVKELIAILGSLAPLLHEIGEKHWATWVEESIRLLQNRDLSGVDYLLRAYGGMGSLNDIAVPAIDSLRSKALELAKYIQRNSN